MPVKGDFSGSSELLSVVVQVVDFAVDKDSAEYSRGQLGERVSLEALPESSSTAVGVLVLQPSNRPEVTDIISRLISSRSSW